MPTARDSDRRRSPRRRPARSPRRRRTAADGAWARARVHGSATSWSSVNSVLCAAASAAPRATVTCAMVCAKTGTGKAFSSCQENR